MKHSSRQGWISSFTEYSNTSFHLVLLASISINFASKLTICDSCEPKNKEDIGTIENQNIKGLLQKDCIIGKGCINEIW